MLVCDIFSGRSDSNSLIQSLTKKGDIMNAAALSTHLTEQEIGLPTPITPEPISKNNMSSKASDTEKLDNAIPNQLEENQVKLQGF